MTISMSRLTSPTPVPGVLTPPSMGTLTSVTLGNPNWVS